MTTAVSSTGTQSSSPRSTVHSMASITRYCVKQVVWRVTSVSIQLNNDSAKSNKIHLEAVRPRSTGNTHTATVCEMHCDAGTYTCKKGKGRKMLESRRHEHIHSSYNSERCHSRNEQGDDLASRASLLLMAPLSRSRSRRSDAHEDPALI
jgi:hypothetical protein